MPADHSDTPALLRIVQGEPTPDEVAALVAALTARAAARPAPEPRAEVSPWVRRPTSLRAPLHPRPGAWRLSAWAPGTRTRATP